MDAKLVVVELPPLETPLLTDELVTALDVVLATLLLTDESEELEESTSDELETLLGELATLLLTDELVTTLDVVLATLLLSEEEELETLLDELEDDLLEDDREL